VKKIYFQVVYFSLASGGKNALKVLLSGVKWWIKTFKSEDPSLSPGLE